MRKRKEKDKGFWIMMGMLMVFLIVTLGLTSSVMGTAFNHTVIVSTGSGYDSSIIITYRNGVHFDSLIATTDTVVALDDDYNWAITKVDFWDGVAEGYPDPAIIYFSKATAGGGGNSVTLYAIDTTGSADTLPGVSFVIQTMTRSAYAGPLGTTSLGSRDFSLPTDSFIVLASRIGYVFPQKTINVSASDTIFDINGANIDISNPSAATLCNVFGFIKSIQDSAYDGAVVTAIRKDGTKAVDTSGVAVIVSDEGVSAVTDSVGKFELYLRKTNSYADTTYGFYDIKATYGTPAIILFEILDFYVPDLSEINLGDTLGLR